VIIAFEGKETYLNRLLESIQMQWTKIEETKTEFFWAEIQKKLHCHLFYSINAQYFHPH
jgi:hypothetical protein